MVGKGGLGGEPVFYTGLQCLIIISGALASIKPVIILRKAEGDEGF